MNLFPLSRIAMTVETISMTLAPHGGQRAARKNAWGSMSEGNTRARGRREADVALARAIARSVHPAATAR